MSHVKYTQGSCPIPVDTEEAYGAGIAAVRGEGPTGRASGTTGCGACRGNWSLGCLQALPLRCPEGSSGLKLTKGLPREEIFCDN